MQKGSANYFHQLLLFIVFLGLILRAIGILNFPLIFDEAHNILSARADNIILTLKAVAPAHPPLYFLIWHWWQFFSGEFIFLRLLSLILGILTILAIAFIGKKFFSWQVGLIAAFLVAISPSQIYYSSIARPYSLAVLETLLIIFFSKKFLDTKSGIIPLSILLLAGLYTHFFFIILLLVLDLYLLLNWQKIKTVFHQWILAHILIFIFYIPVILLSLSTVRSFSVPANTLLKLPFFFTTPMVPWDLVQTLKIFQFRQIDLPSLAAATLILLSLAILVWGVLVLRKNEKIIFLSFIYILPSLIILGISYLLYRISAVRSYTIFSPLFFLILAAFLARLKIKTKMFVLFLLSVLTLFFLVTYSQANFGSKDQLKQVYANFKENDIIVYNDAIIFLPSRILKPKGKHLLMYPGHLGEDEYSLKALNIKITKFFDLPEAKRIWYVRQETNWPPYESVANQLETYLKDHFLEVNRTQYYKFQLILYAPK